MKFNKFVENILAESNKDLYTKGMKKKIDATHKEFCDWLLAEIRQKAEYYTDKEDHAEAYALYDLGETIATKLQEEYTKEEA